jgi:hypothetical protein
MLFLSAFTAVSVIGLTAEHKSPDPAVRRLGGIMVRGRHWRRGGNWLSFASIIAGVHIKQSKEVKNTSWSRLPPAKLSIIGASKAIKVNVPIVARTRYAATVQRSHFLIESQTMGAL